MPYITFLERVSVGIAAASGLLTAACISGMPTASCTALADTYGSAIVLFGLTALLALFTAACLIAMPLVVDRNINKRAKRDAGRNWAVRLCYAGISITLLGSVYFFYSTSISGAHNLLAAMQHCYFGTDAELAERLHKRIELQMTIHDYWWRKILSVPPKPTKMDGMAQ